MSIEIEKHRPMEAVEQIPYTSGLALEIAFAVQEYMEACEAQEKNPCVKNEIREYNKMVKIAKPEWYAALLSHIDRLEGQQERTRVAKRIDRREAV